MKSKKHKVLHPVCGKPMIDYILEQLSQLRPVKSILVVGHLQAELREHLGNRILFVEQLEQLGTAHAVLQAKPLLEAESGMTLVLSGDHPCFRVETFTQLVEKHQLAGAAATLLTALMEDPTGYGRVIRGADGSVARIVEHKDATAAERTLQEINTGTYCFDNQALFSALARVSCHNAQGEYYLPDVISILREDGKPVHAEIVLDADEAMGINDRVQLAQAESYLRQRILRKHMLDGVHIVDPANTYIEADVRIGADTVIQPGTFLRGNTQIGAGCRIGPQADLLDVVVQDGADIQYAVIDSSQIGPAALVGPYVYIRSGTRLAAQTKIGCFVDLKKVHLGQGSKISHLAYVGDAEVGEGVNISCGAITVNYDGIHKYKTMIEDGAFVGCNVNLVAPVSVKKGAYVAAGSTITEDVPENAFAIARERQTTKLDYVPTLLKKRRK
jgi:bifunctional UDP-N-acetylglucosamine pyrophosphorylase / glucosamine-1-phosphate N-acetyltransferase